MTGIDKTVWNNAWRIAQGKGLSPSGFAKAVNARPQTLNNFKNGSENFLLLVQIRIEVLAAVQKKYLLEELLLSTFLPPLVHLGGIISQIELNVKGKVYV